MSLRSFSESRTLLRSGPAMTRSMDSTSEPVELDEKLVEGLLAFVVATAEPGAAVPADRVDLVHEHDRRRVRLRLLEQVAHPRGADADEHLHEVGDVDGVVGDAGLASDRAREKGREGP